MQANLTTGTAFPAGSTRDGIRNHTRRNAFRSVLAVGAAGLAGAMMAGCAPSSGPATTPASSAATHTVDYRPLVEPFSDPGRCDENGSTQEMTACSLVQVQHTDQQVDALQRRQFAAATDDARHQLLTANAAWLAKRGTDCAAAANSGGTIDQINGAGCLLDASRARLAQLQTAVG